MTALGGTGVLNAPLLELTLPDPFPSLLLDYYEQNGQQWAGDLLDFLGGTKVSPGQQLQYPKGSAFYGHNIDRRPSPELRIAQDILQHDMALYPYAAQLQNDPWQYVEKNIGPALFGTLGAPPSTRSQEDQWALLGLGPAWNRNTWGVDNQPLPTTAEGVTPDFLDWFVKSKAFDSAEESAWSSAFSGAANEGFQEGLLRERLDPYQLPSDKTQEIVDYFNKADWGHAGSGANGYQYTNETDPLFPFYQQYYGPDTFKPSSDGGQVANLWSGAPGQSAVRRLGADVIGTGATGGLTQYLNQAGYTVEDPNAGKGTSTALNQGGTPLATDNTTTGTTTATGQTIQPLNVFSPFQSLLAGGYTYLDSQGKPQFVKQTPEQWANVYGTSGIFGQQQASDIADLFHTIPINEQEQAARDLLSTDKATRNAAIAKYPEMQKALAGMHNVLLPGLEELATTGFKTDAPDLYTQGQYDRTKTLADTGNRKPLEDAATTYMNRVVGPQMLAKYAGSIGSFGTDFGGELANQSRIFSGDIADTVNNNQKFGLSMWNDMTSGQGLLESQLGESAAQRRATGQALYQQGLMLPQNFLNAQSRDLADMGGAFRSTDELLRPGRQALSIFQQLAQGAAPGNVGYIAQGKTPSSTAQLLNGGAGMTANFGAANLGGIASNFVGSLLNSSLLSGGGSDDSGRFGYAGDFLGGLGSLLGNGASSLFKGLTGLFGGGGGDPYGDSNYGGSDYNSYDRYA